MNIIIIHIHTLDVSDFSLVDRCFRDKVVENAKVNNHKTISLDDIRQEYFVNIYHYLNERFNFIVFKIKFLFFYYLVNRCINV